MKNCKHCNTALVGRSDKKYCNDLCRSKFNNKRISQSYAFYKMSAFTQANNNKSSIDWIYQQLYNKMKTWDSFKGNREVHIVLEGGELIKLIKQAKAMHREEHGQTWDKSLDNLKARGMNEMRAYTDFDDYYAEKFGGDK